MIASIVSKNIYDLGLRNFMLSVYNHMALALCISGITSFGISMNNTMMAFIWGSSLSLLIILIPVFMSLAFSFMFNNLTLKQTQIYLFAFAVAMGISLSSIFAMYQLGSIAQIFFISASTFGISSLYGYTTKKDLTTLGSFFIMGAIGIVIASLVNIFFQSSLFSFAISFLAVIIFTGLTAYDTQQLKIIFDTTIGKERDKLGVFGALQLYLNFINIFISLLNILGVKKD